jgi:hypothetical protein
MSGTTPLGTTDPRSLSCLGSLSRVKRNDLSNFSQTNHGLSQEPADSLTSAGSRKKRKFADTSLNKPRETFEKSRESDVHTPGKKDTN